MPLQQLLFVSRIAENVNGHFYPSITIDAASKTARDDVTVLGNMVALAQRTASAAMQSNCTVGQNVGSDQCNFMHSLHPSRQYVSFIPSYSSGALGLTCPCATKGEGFGRPCSLSWVWLPTSCASNIAIGLKRNRALRQTIYPPGTSCL